MPSDVVLSSPSDRHAGEARAQEQRHRLPAAVVPCSIVTMSVRGTMTSRARVSPSSKTEWIISRSPASMSSVSPAMSTSSRSSASLCERAVAEALARGDGVAEGDEQPGERPEHPAQPDRTGAATSATGVGVLAAEGARARRRRRRTTTSGHDADGDERRPPRCRRPARRRRGSTITARVASRDDPQERQHRRGMARGSPTTAPGPARRARPSSSSSAARARDIRESAASAAARPNGDERREQRRSARSPGARRPDRVSAAGGRGWRGR